MSLLSHFKTPEPIQKCSNLTSNMKSENTTDSAKVEAEYSVCDPLTPKVSHYQNILTPLVSGGIAGAIGKTIKAPLDRTKINFQVSPDMVYSFRSALKFIGKIYQQEGLLALWRGHSATMVQAMLQGAILFCAHEQYKHLFMKEGEKHLAPLPRFISGSLAGVTASSITYPLDVARARMAVTQKCTYNSLTEVFVKIYQTERLRTFYKGCVPSLMGVILNKGTGFFTYETLKKHYMEMTDSAHINQIYKFGFGAAAGLLGQSVSYPLDTVRRRMQTAEIMGTSGVYTSSWRTFRIILRNEGIKKGLYKGLSLNLIKNSVASGVTFTVYDFVFLEITKHIPLQNNKHL